MDDSLDDLLARAKTGDNEAEGQLIRHLLVRFVTFAKRKVGGKEAAEDIAQNACVTVLEKYKTVAFTESLSAWAYGVLRNKIGNYLQDKGRDALKVRWDSAGDCPSVPPSQEVRRRLIHCFRLLVRRHQHYARVLNLVHQGYKTAEICAKVKITPNNLYVMLNRARRLLKKCMKTGGDVNHAQMQES